MKPIKLPSLKPVSIREIPSEMESWLWNRDLSAMPLWRSSVFHVMQIVAAVMRDLKGGQLSLRAMSLVYTTVLSLVPLFAISFSVMKGLGAHNQIKPFLMNLLEPLGDKRDEIVLKLMQFVDNVQVGVLGAVGIALLLYSVIAMLQKIEESFNYAWHVSIPRTFAESFSDYLSALFIGPVLIFLSAGMTSSVKSKAVIEFLAQFPGTNTLLWIVGLVIPYLILAGAFTFMYSFIPNTKVSLRAAFAGGLLTAFVWKAMGWAFSTFIASSANHAAIYSAFATIIIFMVWIYLAWLVLIVGAAMAFYCQYPDYRQYRQDRAVMNVRFRETLALEVMRHLAQAFHEGTGAPTAEMLSKAIKQPLHVLDDILSILVVSRLITETAEGGFVPSRSLEKISLYDVLASVYYQPKDGISAIKTSAAVAEQLKHIDKSLKAPLTKVTLQDFLK